MNLCMGSLLWLKCHLHNKTPPCFLCWFSNNTVSYTVGISPTACTKSAIFRRFLNAVAKIGHHTHYIKKLAFRQVFFYVFYFFIAKKLSPTYPQFVDKLGITVHSLWVFVEKTKNTKNIEKTLDL